MTFEELHNYVSKQLGNVMQNEDDWRPAGDMYIEDIVHVIDTKHCTIPNGIRIWLNSGDSIIYVKAPKGRRSGMISVETVIRGLECCATGDLGNCKECPYGIKACNELLKDAISLLKAQQPRVMTLKEVKALAEDDLVWYEHVVNILRPRVVYFTDYRRIVFTDGGKWYFEPDDYGKLWRCWTAKPTPDQREAMKWNE